MNKTLGRLAAEFSAAEATQETKHNAAAMITRFMGTGRGFVEKDQGKMEFATSMIASVFDPNMLRIPLPNALRTFYDAFFLPNDRLSYRNHPSNRSPVRLSIRVTILHVVLICLALQFLAINPPDARAQDSESTQQVADKFLQVLVRNPRPGIALDRVYSFHLQNQSLDPLIDSLQAESAVDASDTHQYGSRLMVAGLIQLRRGHAKDAAVALKQAESLLPDHAAVSYQLGLAWIALRDVPSAIEAMERSIQRAPDRIDAADIYLELGKLYCRSGDPQAATDLWQQLIKRFPGDDAMIEKVATALADEQQFDSALQKYHALAENASSPDSRIGYQIKAAEMRERLGQTDAFRNQLQSVLSRLRPGSWLHSDVRSRIERSFLSSGDLEGLTQYYNEQLDRSPDDLTVLVRLAELLSAADQGRQAEEVLERVLQRAPHDVDARLALVEICDADGRAEQAAGHLEQLLIRDPHHPDFLLRLGEIRFGDSNQDLATRQRGASDAWNRLADGKPTDVVLLVTIARRMQSIGQSERATELYRQAVDAAPEQPAYREYLGDHLYKIGQRPGAIAAWQSIANGTARSADSLVRVAEIFSANKLNELALATWREAAKEDLTLEQRLKVALVLSNVMEHEQASAQLEIASNLADRFEEQESVLRVRIDLMKAAGSLAGEIAKLSITEPTPQNRRFLAILLRADGQWNAACAAIEMALTLAPNDITLLTDAVDIFERNGVLQRAAVVLETLARVDARFRTNHLRRLIQIREQLREFPSALRAAEELIAANPAAPDSYRLYADLAFAADEDALGESMLRRAMVVAPRAVEPRLVLAERLANRFETKEAIELLWQAIEFEDRLSNRISLIQKLVPLYSRRGETPELVAAIERLSPDDFDQKTKQVLIANVWAAVKDYQKARSVLQQSLAKRPRDVDVLRHLIDVLFESGDFAAAASLQLRLVAEQDSAENRSRLTSLELKAGLISAHEATLREIQATEDPKRMVAIIGRDSSKDPEQSAELARVVLEKHPDLWDIKIIRAQLLLLSDTEQRANDLAEADRLAEEVVALGLNPAIAAPSYAMPSNQTARQQPNLSAFSVHSVVPSGSVRRAVISAPPVSWFPTPDSRLNQFPQSVGVQLSQFQQLNARRVASRVHNGVKSYSFPLADTYLAPTDFGQVYWIARCVQIIATCERAKLNGQVLTARQAIADRFTTEVNDQEVPSLRQMVQFQLLQSGLMGRYEPPDPALLWQIAAADPAGEHHLLVELLANRSLGRDLVDREPSSAIAPLTDNQLDALLAISQDHREQSFKAVREISEIMADMRLRQFMIAEFRLADRQPPSEFDQTESIQHSGFKLALAEIEAALHERNVTQADQLAAGLIDAARSDTAQQLLMDVPIDWVLSPRTDAELQFIDRHRVTLIDAWLAYCSRRSLLNPFPFSTSELFNAEHSQIVLETSRKTDSRPVYKIFYLQQPITQRLIPQTSLRNIVALMSKGNDVGDSVTGLLVTDEFLEHLSIPLQGAPLPENKFRRLVAAYATWWDGRPDDCLIRIEQLANDFPDDIDLQMEAARLTIVNRRPQEAFQRHDRISTVDDQAQLEITIARILLAAQAKDERVLRSAGEELLSGPIDTATIDVLTRRLQALGSNFPSAEGLRQSIAQRKSTVPPTTSGALSDSKQSEEKLRMAQSLLESGDVITAAEIAYSILNRTSPQHRMDLIEIKRRAMDLVVKTGRVQSLVAESERDFHAVSSDAHRQQLADLYIAGGSPLQAMGLWHELVKTNHWSARAMLARANEHRSRREFNHAAMFYLLAFDNDPLQWQSHWNTFVDTAAMSTIQDTIYDRLTARNLEGCSLFSLCELIRMPGSGVFSDARRRFVNRVVTTHADVTGNLDLILESIPDSQRPSFPVLMSLMTDAISGDQAFHVDSPVWIMRGWNDHGQVNGPLADLMSFLHSNPQASTKFLSSVQTSQQNDQDASVPIRKLLLSLYELKSINTRDAAMVRIRELCPAAFDPDVQTEAATSSSAGSLPAGLLWQAGQYLESLDLPADVAMLQVGLFQAAARETANHLILQTSIGLPHDQLYDAYVAVGRRDLARRAWLDRLRDYDYPRTTGIREHRQLQIADHIAKRLMQVGYPVDAASVLRQHLNKPLTFRIAQPYSQGVNYERKFETNLLTAMGFIDSDAACDHLVQLHQDARSTGGAIPVPLDLIRFEQLSETESDCLLEFAIRQAVKSETGLRAAEELLTRLDQTATSQSNPSLNLSARMMLASVLRPRSLSELLDSMDEQLAKSSDPPLAMLRTQVVVMGAINRSNVSESAASYEKVLLRLRTIAEQAEERRLSISLTKLSWSSSAMHLVLDEWRREKGRRSMTLADIAWHLELAERASGRQHWDVIARCLTAALANGPPQFTPLESSQVADPFGGQVKSRLASVGDPELAIRESVLAILGACRDDQGHSLSSPNFDVREINLTVDHQRALDVALQKIMIPSETFVNVFAYKQSFLTSQGDANETSDGAIHAVSYAAGHLAKACGTANTLAQRIEKRAAVSNAAEVSSLYVDLMVCGNDMTAIAHAVDHFFQSMDDQLPRIASEHETPSTKPILPRDELPIQAIADQVISTLWPLLDRQNLLPHTRQQIESLLRRTVVLLRSNQQTADRYQSLINQIESVSDKL